MNEFSLFILAIRSVQHLHIKKAQEWLYWLLSKGPQGSVSNSGTLSLGQVYLQEAAFNKSVVLLSRFLRLFL